MVVEFVAAGLRVLQSPFTSCSVWVAASCVGYDRGKRILFDPGIGCPSSDIPAGPKIAASSSLIKLGVLEKREGIDTKVLKLLRVPPVAVQIL